MKSSKTATEAMRIQSNLMNQMSQSGKPILAGALNYSRDFLDQLDSKGLPAYAQRAYAAARGSAMEQADAEAQRGRMGYRGGEGNALLKSIPAFQGAAEAYAKENASIAATQAASTLSERNQMLQSMTGGAAQAVNLSAGFGGLTNRGLMAGMNAGVPAYEATVGGAAALAPILLTALQKDPSYYNTAGQKSFLADYARGDRFVPMIG